MAAGCAPGRWGPPAREPLLDARLARPSAGDRLFNCVVLPVLRCAVRLKLRRFQQRHAVDTLNAHRLARGETPHGEAWLGEFLARTPFSMLVFYRGLWWPYWEKQLQELDGLSQEIESLGGQILVITSESQAYADQAKSTWRLPTLELLGDPSLSLATYLRQSGLLDVFISMPDPAMDPWAAGHPFMCSYTNGIAQPATLVVSREREVWFSHVVVPNRQNAGGAVDRPLLGDVWAEVKATKLGASDFSAVAAARPRQVRKQTIFASPLGYAMAGAFGATALLALYGGWRLKSALA